MKDMNNFFRVKDINLQFLDTRMGLLFFRRTHGWDGLGYHKHTWIVYSNRTGSSRCNTARVHRWITILEHSIIEHLYVYRYGVGYDQSYTRRYMYGPRRIIFVPYPCVYPWIARCIYRPSLESLYLESLASRISKFYSYEPSCPSSQSTPHAAIPVEVGA